jgi:hypothetical protein
MQRVVWALVRGAKAFHGAAYMVVNFFAFTVMTPDILGSILGHHGFRTDVITARCRSFTTQVVICIGALTCRAWSGCCTFDVNVVEGASICCALSIFSTASLDAGRRAVGLCTHNAARI